RSPGDQLVLSGYDPSNAPSHCARGDYQTPRQRPTESRQLCRHLSYTSRRTLLTATTAFARYYWCAQTRSRIAAGQHSEVIMQTTLKTLLGVAGIVFATQAAAQITFYEGEGFRGRTFATDKTIWDFERFGFNDRASSAVVDGGSWQVCEDAQFSGRCVILNPGRYESLAGMGMNRRISSVRPIDSNARYDTGPAPIAAQTYDYRQRPK